MDAEISDREKIRRLEEEIENMSEELLVTYEELGILYELSQHYSDVDRIDKILDVTLREVNKTIPCSWVSISMLEGDALNVACCRGDESLAGARDELLTLNDCKPRMRNGHRCAAGGLQNMLLIPLAFHSRLIGVLQASNKLDGDVFTTKDLKLLRAISNQASVSIHNIQSYQQRLEYERMLKELQLAHEIQMRLLPDKFPAFDEMEIFARCVPADAVGGDFYDLIKTPDDNLAVIVADVSGHGLSSALTMINARSVLRSHMAADPISPDAALGNVNRMIFEDLDGTGNFITMFLGVIDRRGMALTYANAGHPPPILYSPADNRVHALGATSMPIAIESDVKFPAVSRPIAAGATLMLYTDGLTEAADLNDEQYGYDRLVELVRNNHGLGARDMAGLVFDSIVGFAASQSFHDDQTLMVIKFR